MLIGLVRFLGWLPLSLNRLLGRFIGRLLWWIPNSNKKVTERNIQAAFPQLNPTEQRQLSRESLLQLGMATAELGPMWCWSADKLMPLVKEVKGQALLDAAIAEGRGVIFLGPHIGAWELVGNWLALHYPLTAMYRPPNIASVEGFMLDSRNRFGGHYIPAELRGVREIIKALKHSGVTGILPDQDPGDNGGVYAPFFGRPARTMTLVAKLLQKAQCACLLVMAERLPGTEGFRLHFLPAEADIASDDDVVAAAALNRGVEACVQIAPAQYLWAYKRYRKPPAGIDDIYKA
nr:lysophospholipid acyltransferase family protein [Thiomicrorhabdus cannonii]